jgi:putative membrane protein
LTQLAQQKGIALPADMDAKHKQLIDRLSKLSGAEFDRAYSWEMLRDHDADVKEFQHEAKSGKDAEVKAWAAQTLPVLQEHQRQAHQLTANVGRWPSRGTPSMGQRARRLRRPARLLRPA